ncbi:MAG: integrase family protein [Gammaproteobacteria bacterium]|nr:integrase family protein [Gammaproteobacteria bacterium]
MRRNLTETLLPQLTPPASGRLEVIDVQVPGFGVRIGRSGSRTFFIQYRIDGKQVRQTLGRHPAMTLLEGRRTAARFADLARAGLDPRQELLAPEGNRFDIVADQFLHRYAARHQRPKTLRETQRYIDGVLKPAWESRDITTIHKADIFRVLDALVDRGVEITANRCLATIRRLFNWCQERGYVERSPVDGIRPPARERPRTRVLTDRELGAIWNATGELGFPAGAWVQMMIVTGGQRVRDVVTMRHSEIQGDVWRIEHPTKSESPHNVPLSTLAMELLSVAPSLEGDFVFSTTNGHKHIQALSKIKRKLDDASGVKDWRYHDIRRTVATAFGEHLALPPHIAEAVQNRRSGTVSGVVAVYNRAQYERAKRDALEAWSTYVRNAAQIGPIHATARIR